MPGAHRAHYQTAAEPFSLASRNAKTTPQPISALNKFMGMVASNHFPEYPQNAWHCVPTITWELQCLKGTRKRSHTVPRVC